MVLGHLTRTLQQFTLRTDITPPKPLHVLLWAVGAALLIVMTMKDVGPLVYQYKTNNIAPRVKVNAGNDTIKPPAMTFCLPRTSASLRRIAEYLHQRSARTIVDGKDEATNATCDECDQLSAQSWDVWTTMTDSHTLGSSSADDYRRRLSAALSKRLFRSDIDLWALSSNNSHWNRALLDAAWDLLDCVGNLDTLSDDVDANPSCSHHDVQIALAAPHRIRYVYDRVMDSICVHLRFRFNPDSCADVLALTQGVVYSNLFCLQLPMLENGSYVQFHPFVRRHNNNVSWPAAVDGTDPYYADEETHMVSWPLDEGDMIYVSDPSNPALKYQHYEERVFLKYFIVLTVSENRRGESCYDESGPIVCKGNCMVAEIARRCECVPFTFRKRLPPDLLVDLRNETASFCTPRHYRECGFNKSEATVVCMDRCANPCSYAAYHWHVTRLIVPPTIGRKVFALYVRPLLSPFVEFAVDRKDTPEQFFSQVAAVFNLYMGLSGMTLVGVCIGCIELVKKWIASRRKRDRESKLSVVASTYDQMQESELSTSTNAEQSSSGAGGLTRVNLYPRSTLGMVDSGQREIEELRRRLEDASRCNMQLKNQLETQGRALGEIRANVNRFERFKFQN